MEKIIPQSEVKLVRKAIDDVKEIIDNHTNLKPTIGDFEKMGNSSFSRVKLIMYLKFLKEFISYAKTLEDVLDLTEEDLADRLAKDGETIESFEKKAIINTIAEMLDK